nr:helix-turn-helix domain-containing protein [Mycobacterium marseillense]
MPLPPLASVVREFWEHVGKGCTAAEAGVAVGVSERAGICWFRDAGGVKPRLSEPTTSGRRPRLTLRERVQIDIGVKTNESLHSIGQRLGRPASTIKREIDANGGHHVGRTSGYRRKDAFGARQSGRAAQVGYDAFVAQARSDQRARRPKVGKLAANAALHDEVQARLLDEHSPEQIAKRLPMDFRACQGFCVTSCARWG